jgi:hypothetical protein
MMKSMRVILIPIDGRPVTYSFPQMIAATAGIEAIVPPHELMGTKGVPADLNKIGQWLEESLSKFKPAALFVCLDTILYGGLGPSRRSLDSFAEVSKRAQRIASWRGLGGADLKVFAQASIMRIPHYNASGEEPEYWQHYGERIFRWSTLKHKEKLGTLASQDDLRALEAEIPQEVRTDFAGRRDRNFQINQSLIEMAQNGAIDFLVFSQDDTAEFGMNVWEKTQLAAKIRAARLTNVVAYPGADETITTLFSRWLISTCASAPRTSIQFSPDQGKKVNSNYEGQTIGASVNVVADVTGLDVVQPPAKSLDLAVIVHTASKEQGDHTQLTQSTDMLHLDTAKEVDNTIKLMELATAPVILCDVAYSNGADPLLVEHLLKKRNLLAKLWAYGGWNTTNNTVGAALALGVAHWYGQNHSVLNEAAFKRAMFVRFADDWAYQTRVRSQLAGQANEERVRQLMAPRVEELKKALAFNPGAITLKLPWKRTFEIEVGLPPLTETARLGRMG